MRQNQSAIGAIAERAHALGYDGLTYGEISRGLRRAPADLHLPIQTSAFLRRRYLEVARDFNSFKIMKDLVQEALSKIGELEEELMDPGISGSRKAIIESELYRWYGRAFGWSEQCSVLAIKMQGVNVRSPFGDDDVPDQARDQRRTTDDIKTEIEELAKEFQRQLPSPPSHDGLVMLYGPDNVRPVGVVIDGDTGDLDDDDDEG
jgi:hypothetical protein